MNSRAGTFRAKLCRLVMAFFAAGASAGAQEPPSFGPGIVAGTVQYSEITEASGLAASRNNPYVIWTHNDRGDRARIFALDTSGSLLGVYDLPGVSTYDPEDIAIGPGPQPGVDYLYLGDIGDKRQARSTVPIYRIPEPAIYAAQAFDPGEYDLRGVQPVLVSYLDMEHNAEALMVDPISGDLFIATKSFGATNIYTATAAQMTSGQHVTLSYVSTIPFDFGSNTATAADISVSGREIIIKGYDFANLWIRQPGQSVADALNEPYINIPIAPEPHGEAVAFDSAGSGHFTLSEGTHQPLYYFPRTSGEQQRLPVTLIEPGGQWKYLDNGSNQGAAWASPAFDDSAWQTGIGQFGYGDNDEGTPTSFGPNPSNKFVTTYFRTEFEVTDPSITSLLLKMVFDDGAVVYLNGHEVLRLNLSADSDYLTLALAEQNDLEGTWFTFKLDSKYLVLGRNTLAVEIHQFSRLDDDVSFDLQLLGSIRRVPEPGSALLAMMAIVGLLPMAGRACVNVAGSGEDRKRNLFSCQVRRYAAKLTRIKESIT